MTPTKPTALGVGYKVRHTLGKGILDLLLKTKAGWGNTCLVILSCFEDESDTGSFTADEEREK